MKLIFSWTAKKATWNFYRCNEDSYQILRWNFNSIWLLFHAKKKKQITKPEYQNQNKMQNHKRWNSLNRILTSLKTWPISLEHNLWFLFLVGVLIKWTRIHANCRFQLKIVYRCVVAPRNSCEAFINRDFIYRETAAHTHWIETHSLN